VNRNDATIPWLALLTASALFLVLAYSFSTHPPPEPAAAQVPRLDFVPSHLYLYEVFLTSVIMILAIYGIHGLVSVWLEGRELEPGRRPTRNSPWAFWAILACLSAVLAISVAFAGAIAEGLRAGPDTVREGFLMGSLLLLFALALALYKHHFLPDEVLVEDPDTDVPW
jgi:hypothetical protein